MKDFDAERKIREDRSFKIGGREFRFRVSVQQELVDGYYDSLTNDEISNSDVLRACDALVEAGLEPDCRAGWADLRSAESESPLMSRDIHNVINYMLEVMLDRPIESPSDSGDTPEPIGTSLMDKSPQSVETT